MTEPVIAGDDFSVFLDPFFFTFPTANENSLAQDYSKATFREVAEDEDDAEVEPLKNSFSALKDQLMILDTCRSDVLKLPVIGWLPSTSPFDTEIARVFLVLDMSFTIGGDVEQLFTAIKKMNPDETHSPELQEMWTGLNLSLHRRLRTIYDSEGNSTIVSKYYICFAALVKACGQYSFHLAFALIALTLIPAIILASLELEETDSRWTNVAVAAVGVIGGLVVWFSGPASDHWYQTTQTNIKHLDRQKQYHLAAYKELYQLLTPGQISPSALRDMRLYIRNCRKTFVKGWNEVPAIKQALIKPSA